MGVDVISPACGGMHEERLFIETRHNAVIHQKAVLIAHKTITAATRFQGAHHIGVEHIHKPPRIRPFDDDLAQGRCIKQTKRAAGGIDLAGHGCVAIFARPWIAIGAPPLTHWLKISAMFSVPVKDRGAAQRLENRATRLACDGPHGNGRIRWAEGGGSHSRDLRLKRISKHRKAIDIAKLSLISRHTQCGIAFGMLNAFIALARGQLNVRHFHIVLEIKPHFCTFLNGCAGGHDPNRGQGP